LPTQDRPIFLLPSRAKKRGKGYQTRANSILRQRMLDETKHA